MELEIGFRVTRNVGDINFVSTETEASFFLAAYLPGFTKDEIEVAMRKEERQIIIRGRGHITNQESVTTRRLAISREIFFEGFDESFAAPDGIDWGDINAHFDEEEHILIISIPKLTREESLDIGAEEIPGYTIQLGQASEELDSIQDLGDDRNGEYKPKEWKRPEQIEQKEEKEAHKRLPHWSPMGESTDLHLEKEHLQVKAPTDPSQQPKMKEAVQSIELAAEHLQLEQEEETAPKQVTPKGKKAMQAAVELQPPKPKGQEQKHLPYKEMEALEDNYHATEEHRKLPERTKDDSSMTVECRETEVPTKEFYPPKQAVQLTSPEKDKPKPPTEPPKEHPQPKAYEEHQTPTTRPKDKELAAVVLPEKRECDGQPPEHKYKSSKITMPETRPPPEQEDEKPKLAPIYKEHEVSKLQEKEEPKIEVYKPMEDNLESKHQALKLVTFEEQLTQKSKRPSEGISYDESETPKSIETKQNHQKPTFIQTKQPGVKEPDEGLEPAKLIQSDILDEEFKQHKLEEREYESSVISPKYDQQPNATELPKEIELLPWLHMHKEDREKQWENLEKKSSETNEKLKSKEISQDLKQEMEQKQKLHPVEVPTFPHPILEVLEQLTPETPTDIMQKLPQFKVQEPRESKQDLTQEKNGQYLPEGIQKIASNHYLQEQYAEIQPSKEQEGKPSLGKKLQEQAKLKDDIYQLKEEEKTPPSKYNEAKHEGIKPVFIERKPYQQEQETQKPTPEQKKKPSIVEPPNVKEQETEEVLTQRELQPREESKEKQKVTLEPLDKSLKMIELKTKEEEQPGFKFQLQEPQEDNSHQPQDRKEKEQPEETCKMPTHKEEITKGIQLPEAAATYTPEPNSSALSEEVFAELQQSKQDDAKPPLQPMAVEEQGIKALFEQQKKEEVPRQIQKSALMQICQETEEKETQFVVEDGAIVEPIPESRKHDQVEKHLLDKELPTLELMKLEPEHLQKIAEQDYKFRQLQETKEKEDGQRGKFSLQLTTEDKRKKDPKQLTKDKYELDRTTASQKQQAKLQQEEEEFKPSLGKELPESGKSMQQIFQLEEENLSQPSELDYMEEPGIETFPKQGAYKKKESKKFQKPEVEPPLEATQRKKQKAQEECEQKLQLQTKGDETKSLEPQQTTEKEERQRGIPGEHESIFKSEGQFLITQIPEKEDQIPPLGNEKHEKTKPKKKAIQLAEVAPAEEPSLLLETSAVSEMLEPLHYEESKERQKLEVPPLIQAPKRES
ncbi:hypothetical protein HPP92_004419 [Vanilla planifolia]|uniref:SHSP domain-containing protein n=1 Tax=Vanilla planifolia TaxID=51239 RepID=A0A835S9D5_VANPL|nr:hypothetical protein HPP92_004419 [Vanilla planifolia]